MENINIFILYFIWINVITFSIYGIDKVYAIKNKKRVREKIFKVLAMVGGSFGSIFAMNIFRHKINNKKIVSLNYLMTIFWIILLLLIFT